MLIVNSMCAGATYTCDGVNAIQQSRLSYGAARSQGALVAVMEEQLYAGEEGAEGGGAVYPAALVALTSVLGFAAARRLVATGAIGSLASWALQCIAVAKLSMLLLPEVRLMQFV